MTTSLILILLSVLGTLNAAYLSYAHLLDSGGCGTGSRCDEVMASPYSSLGGVPLSVFGLGLYFAILIASWRSLHGNLRVESIRWVSLFALVGNLPTLFLLYLQAFVIGAWCVFCTLSAATILSILVLSLTDRNHNAVLWPFVGSLTSRDIIPLVSAVFFVPFAYLIVEAAFSAPKANPDLTAEEIVARIGDREITIREIDQGIRLKLYEQRNEFRKAWLEKQILETAAKERGMPVREFVQKEIYSVIEISQEEIDKRFEEIKDRLPKNITKEMVIRNLRGEIGNRKSQRALGAYVERLRTTYATTYKPPAAERFTLDPNPRGGPEKGSLDARVTIVEFSDFQCGHCARAHVYLDDLLNRKADEVRVVFRHLPLEIHEHARHAAEVAACANRQDKFWPLAKVMFKEQKHLEADRVATYAEQAGLDVEELNSCLESGVGAQDVDADIAEADGLGISSTPTFFINGHYIGSLPKQGLDDLIENEINLIR